MTKQAFLILSNRRTHMDIRTEIETPEYNKIDLAYHYQNLTIEDIIVIANIFLNEEKTGNADIDNRNDFIGKMLIKDLNRAVEGRRYEDI